MNPLSPLELTTLVNTLSVAIAQNLSQSELALASTIFTQIGDTLATIAVINQQQAQRHPLEHFMETGPIEPRPPQ